MEPAVDHVVQYFGDKVDLAFLVDATYQQVPVPVGQACMYCTEQVDETDRGFLRAVMRSETSATVEPVHIECDLRSMLGSPRHLRGECSCFRRDRPETDDRSWREQAREVVAMLNTERAAVGHGPLW